MHVITGLMLKLNILFMLLKALSADFLIGLGFLSFYEGNVDVVSRKLKLITTLA